MLSVRQIEAAKPDPKKDRRIADGEGLYLKVSRYGAKTFVFRYTYVAKRKEVTLGTYPAMSLADAREERLVQQRVLESGRDPVQVKESARAEKLSALTVDQLIEEFYHKHLKLHFEQPDEARRTLLRDVSPVIGKLLVPDVTKKEVTQTINKIVQRGSKVAANRTLTLTRRMFDYAVDQHHIEDTPVTMTRKAAGGKEKSKTTNLSFEQIGVVLKLMAPDVRSHRVSWQTRAALRLLLATSKRPSEVVTMEWAHLPGDGGLEARIDRGVWINPKHLTKEKRDDHLVFLNDFGKDILRALVPLTGGQRFVFPSPKSTPAKPAHLARHSLSAAVLDLHKAGVIAFKFTPHDMRRTFSSRMADLGVMPHVVEKILDHQMEGVMAVYNRATYLPDRKAAMDLWGTTLAELESVATD